jgi:hypothetical protein
LPLIASLGAIITLQVTRGHSYDDEPIRYVDTVSTVNLTQDGLVTQILATRQSPNEKFVYPPEQLLHETLRKKFDIKDSSIFSEIELRGHYLSQFRNKGLSTRDEIRKEVKKYYLSRFSCST